jgi:hypothetical protein
MRIREAVIPKPIVLHGTTVLQIENGDQNDIGKRSIKAREIKLDMGCGALSPLRQTASARRWRAYRQSSRQLRPSIGALRKAIHK